MKCEKVKIVLSRRRVNDSPFLLVELVASDSHSKF